MQDEDLNELGNGFVLLLLLVFGTIVLGAVSAFFLGACYALFYITSHVWAALAVVALGCILHRVVYAAHRD